MKWLEVFRISLIDQLKNNSHSKRLWQFPSSNYFVLTDPVANDEFLRENLVDLEENLILEEVAE